MFWRCSMTVEEMKNIDIGIVDRDELVDIRSVKIDPDLPREQRIQSFLEQIKNPYCYLCGDVVVKISFSEKGSTMQECMEHYIRTR